MLRALGFNLALFLLFKMGISKDVRHVFISKFQEMVNNSNNTLASTWGMCSEFRIKKKNHQEGDQ